MFIAITTISIFAVAGVAWLVNRILPFKICPICAGVSGTWGWMLGAKFLGYEIDMIVLAMLMGGSVVGIAYRLEKRLPAGRSPLLWKTFFISFGFVAVYSAISLVMGESTLGLLAPKHFEGSNPLWWFVLTAAITTLIIWAFGYTREPRSRAMSLPRTKNNKAVEELEKKMKKCC